MTRRQPDLWVEGWLETPEDVPDGLDDVLHVEEIEEAGRLSKDQFSREPFVHLHLRCNPLTRGVHSAGPLELCLHVDVVGSRGPTDPYLRNRIGAAEADEVAWRFDREAGCLLKPMLIRVVDEGEDRQGLTVRLVPGVVRLKIIDLSLPPVGHPREVLVADRGLAPTSSLRLPVVLLNLENGESRALPLRLPAPFKRQRVDHLVKSTPGAVCDLPNRDSPGTRERLGVPSYIEDLVAGLSVRSEGELRRVFFEELRHVAVERVELHFGPCRYDSTVV